MVLVNWFGLKVEEPRCFSSLFNDLWLPVSASLSHIFKHVSTKGNIVSHHRLFN